MVDSGVERGRLLERLVNERRQMVLNVVHAMTQADDLRTDVRRDRHDVGGHRVAVVEEMGVRREGEHVASDVDQDGRGTQQP